MRLPVMPFLPVLLLASPVTLRAQDPKPGIDIQLASGSAREQRGREQLLRLLARYDLSPWIFTRTVRIESGAIPHSHPVLTLNTRYLDDDTAQVATFMHEQLHWFLANREAATDAGIADLRRLYPAVPAGPPEGARDEASTYLHLLVCMLEFDGVRALLGEPAARQTLGKSRHYTWIYREVLDRPAPLRKILREHGLEHAVKSTR